METLNFYTLPFSIRELGFYKLSLHPKVYIGHYNVLFVRGAPIIRFFIERLTRFMEKESDLVALIHKRVLGYLKQTHNSQPRYIDKIPFPHGEYHYGLLSNDLTIFLKEVREGSFKNEEVAYYLKSVFIETTDKAIEEMLGDFISRKLPTLTHKISPKITSFPNLLLIEMGRGELKLTFNPSLPIPIDELANPQYTPLIKDEFLKFPTIPVVIDIS